MDEHYGRPTVPSTSSSKLMSQQAVHTKRDQQAIPPNDRTFLAGKWLIYLQKQSICMYIFYNRSISYYMQKYDSTTQLNHSIRQKMFFERQYAFDFWQPQLKLIKVFPAVDQTFFLILESSQYHKYMHYYRLVDKDGLFLFEYKNQMPLRAQKHFLPIMINDKELLFFDINKNHINVFNIQDHLIRNFACNCFSSSSINATAYYFHETNIVGLFEGEYCGNEVLKMKVTYFNMVSDTVKERQSERLANGSIQVFKANCQSMILSFKRKEKLIYVFTMSNIVKIDVGQSLPSLAIQGVWEHKQNQILVTVCGGHHFLDYVISLRSRSIRKKEYFHNQQQNPYLYKLLSIKDYYYYVDHRLYYNYYKFYNNEDKLLQKLKIPSDRHREKKSFHLLEHRDAFIVFYQQQKKMSRKLMIKQVSIWSEKEVKIHLMLHINQAFDDELISDVTSFY